MENRRQVFAMLGAALAAAGASSANAKVTDDVLGSDKAQKLEFPFGVQHIYYQGPTDMLQVFEGGSLLLSSGMEPHPPHKHPEEEILLITEGSGEISIEGEITKVGPGSMMFTGANRLHGIKNTGKTPLLFYYFKWLKA
ncbi:MAG: cupin domain-containing protein [Bryobacterales bacterium]|nr:cupin domain-containing protein [Acidobacteriota bacterium]MCB9384837.1 cupin domain-containing protein [Bryobacterales bacterium]